MCQWPVHIHSSVPTSEINVFEIKPEKSQTKCCGWALESWQSLCRQRAACAPWRLTPHHTTQSALVLTTEVHHCSQSSLLLTELKRHTGGVIVPTLDSANSFTLELHWLWSLVCVSPFPHWCPRPPTMARKLSQTFVPITGICTKCSDICENMFSVAVCGPRPLLVFCSGSIRRRDGVTAVVRLPCSHHHHHHY